MRHLLISALLALVLTHDVPAQALSIRVGTLGPGLDFSMPVSRNVALRAGGNFFTFSQHASAADEDVDVDFEGRLRWGGIRLFSDWHPFANGLRLSAGFYYNLIEASGSGIPTEPFYLNEGQASEKVFEPERLGSLSARLTYPNRLNPFVGLGFGRASGRRRVAFVADAGVLYLGPPAVTMKGTGMIAGTASQDARLTEGLDSFRWLPVVSLGVAVRFRVPDAP